MSRKEARVRKKDDNHRQHQRAKSRTTTRRNMSDKLNIQNDFEVYHEANYVGPKLLESYCPNKTIEWKRSWTYSRRNLNQNRSKLLGTPFIEPPTYMMMGQI
nr:unnamed protein product [Callosobruchus analis]